MELLLAISSLRFSILSCWILPPDFTGSKGTGSGEVLLPNQLLTVLNNGVLVGADGVGVALLVTVGIEANAGVMVPKTGAVGGTDAVVGASTGVVGNDLGRSFKGTLTAVLGADAWMLAGGDGVLAGEDLMVVGGEAGLCFCSLVDFLVLPWGSILVMVLDLVVGIPGGEVAK